MPAISNSSVRPGSSSVVRLPLRPTPAGQPLIRRDIAQLLAALRAEEARHATATAAIYAEINVSLSEAGALERAPAGERRHSKKQAAAELGLSEKRLMGIIGRYHEQHPSHLPIAVQPGGSKHSPWIVYTDRVRTVIDSGAPY